MAEATKRCGFQVVSDGTPGGTKIYYQPEEGERVQINCVSEFSMKMNGENSFYDITLIGELLGLELEVDRKQVRVTHDVQPPSPAPVWVPQQPLPLLEAMSMETFKGCLNIMERQPIKSEIHNRLPPLAVIPDISRDDSYYNGKPAPAVLTESSPNPNRYSESEYARRYWETKQ